MATTLTFNATTKIWSRTNAGIISYPSTVNAAAGGPYVVNAITVPFDPINGTGGSFWQLTEGPNVGFLVSAWTNTLGYGNITVTIGSGDYVPPANPSFPTINPLADWRLLIKGLGGPTGSSTAQTLTFTASTKIWSRTNAGIISYPSTVNAAIGGPYKVNPITVPYDPIHKTGGSFYRLTEGPNTGFLVSFWTNALGYGTITVGAGAGFNRGPGATLATIYRPAAHLAGASINYNAAGELHFTLLVDDPNINIPLPKRTHYALEFFDTVSATWVEVFAGLIWDMDATDTEVVFYGVDYLGLFQYVLDARFTTAGNIDVPVEKGGSKYVNWNIKQIITEQLQQAIGQSDSLVGFIKYGSVDSDLGKFRISAMYSTFRQTLDFVVGLIDSYRAGSGKYTRIRVVKEGTDYVVRVAANPGVPRDNLLLRYGQLAQGYRVIPFGDKWASRVGLIGQDKTGLKITYKSVAGAALEAEWGRIVQPAAVVQTQDDNDLLRRTNQAAVDAAALGRKISIGLKLGSFRPLEGFDLCDWVPVDIDHGAVHTMQWGSDALGAELFDGSGTPISSGYWTITGIKWESYDDGHWMTGLSLYPKNAVPYTPADAEPAYGGLGGRGGAGVFGAEITGVEPRPAFVTSVRYLSTSADPGAFALPVSPALTTTRGMIVFVGVGYLNPTLWNQAPPAGWTRLYNDITGNNGALYIMYQIFDPVTNPLPATLSPSVTLSKNWAGGAAVMTGFYTDDPGTPIAIRQTGSGQNTLPGGGSTVTWASPPVGSSLLLAFAAAGYYFGATGPSRGAVYSPSYLPKENRYTLIGWKDIGLNNWDNVGSGRQAYNTQYGSGTYLDDDAAGFTCMYRLPYTVGDVAKPALSTGNGPPTADTTKADNYTDLVTGIQWTYDWATGQWTQVPGTGNTASGVYDFTFAAATVWVVVHTLVGYPLVTIRLTSGQVIEADIVYNSNAQITITFSSAVAGSVHLG